MQTIINLTRHYLHVQQKENSDQQEKPGRNVCKQQPQRIVHLSQQCAFRVFQNQRNQHKKGLGFYLALNSLGLIAMRYMQNPRNGKKFPSLHEQFQGVFQLVYDDYAPCVRKRPMSNTPHFSSAAVSASASCRKTLHSPLQRHTIIQRPVQPALVGSLREINIKQRKCKQDTCILNYQMKKGPPMKLYSSSQAISV